MIRTERRAAIYARISTDKQNPLSPADQRRKSAQVAHGKTDDRDRDSEIYVDEGLSGTGMDRPGLQGLLKAAYSPARSFDVILVDDTSRLSRQAPLTSSQSITNSNSAGCSSSRSARISTACKTRPKPTSQSRG